MTTWLLGIGLGALVAIYMTHPRFRRHTLSSARFFKGLPPPRKGNSQLRFARPRFTVPFFLQVSALLLLLAAVVWTNKTFNAEETKGTGLWLILDTSASMSTIQDGEPRMTAALRKAEEIIDEAQRQTKNHAVCVNLSSMDLELRDWVTDGNIQAVRQVIRTLEPRPLGTDVRLIRRCLNSPAVPAESAGSRCPVTHIVVVGDLPAPAWLSGEGEPRVIWFDIGKKVDNIGFTGIQAARNPLTGLVAEIYLEVAAFGSPPAGGRLSVTAPDNSPVIDEALDGRSLPWRGSFRPARQGKYRMRLEPGGAYGYDDTAVIEFGEEQGIRVDWQLKSDRFVRQMGWKNSAVNPHLRVTPAGGSVLKINRKINGKNNRNVPTLVVGNGYKSGGSEPAVIGDFIETSPLIRDLNFDALESLELTGLVVPEEVQPVLRGNDGRVWGAQSASPLRAYVPGLPTGTDDIAGRISATFFFNALRWLLQERKLPPLYTLTTPDKPNPGGNRLALHGDEGNTARRNRSMGGLDDLKPVPIKKAAPPLWPVLLAAAVILFMIERIIASAGLLKV